MATHLAASNSLMSFQGYMKAVKIQLAEKNPDRVPIFEKGAAAYAKKIVANFKDLEFVSPRSHRSMLFILIIMCSTRVNP